MMRRTSYQLGVFGLAIGLLGVGCAATLQELGLDDECDHHRLFIEEANIASIAPGESKDSPDYNCNTKCEASSETSWSLPEGKPSSGTVQVIETSHCHGIGGSGSSGIAGYPDPGTSSISIPAFDAKNLCGEADPIIYRFTVHNLTDRTITEIHTGVSCKL